MNAYFAIDEASRIETSNLVARVKQLFFKSVESTPKEGPFRREMEAELSPESPFSKRPEYLLQDIQADIRDFCVVCMFAQSHHLKVPALKLCNRFVPVLPPPNYIRYFAELGLAYGFWPRRYWATENAQNIEWTAAAETFFHGITGTVAARIAAFRFWRKQSTDDPGRGDNSSNPPPNTVPRNRPNGQWWTVNTVASGLSLYYAGTHAIRNPPYYLAGLTTPIDVFLPFGTLHIAADAGPKGSIIWDNSIISVPSATPVFTTKVF